MTIARQHCAISVDELAHIYTTGSVNTQILNSVSFSVSAGETVALIGRSGSGKSTLLNLISGLEPIQSGEVRLNQQALSTMNDKQRTLLRGTQIGFVYQAFNLIPTLSVADNISLPLALANMKAAEQRARLDDMLHVIGLGGRGNDFPDQLSGGEQQRVAIARALIHRPALILADEPTGNLDAVSGRLVLDLLNELVDAHDSALLLVTHSGEVAAVADRVVLLDQGNMKTLETHELSNSAAW
ncbi:MAG: putative ABC transport system ATP-binding protein [bacterium]